MFHRLPPACEKCQAVCRTVVGLRTADGHNPVVGFLPHDELDKLAEAGHIEVGVFLYRCRRCGSCWEYEEWSYFPESSRLRHIRPVASLEEWRTKQHRRLKPPSLLFSALLLFAAGLLVITAFAGIAWLVNTWFSFDAANWVVLGLVLGCLVFVVWMSQSSGA
jgi:hypothetical protein